MLTPAPTDLSRRRAAAHLCCLEMDYLLVSTNIDNRGRAQVMVTHRDLGRWFTWCLNEMTRRSLQQQCRRD